MAFCLLLEKPIFCTVVIFFASVLGTNFDQQIKDDSSQSNAVKEFIQSLRKHKDDLEWVDKLSYQYQGVPEVMFPNLNYANVLSDFYEHNRKRNLAHILQRFKNRKLNRNYPSIRQKRQSKRVKLKVKDIDDGLTGVLKLEGYKTQRVGKREICTDKEKCITKMETSTTSTTLQSQKNNDDKKVFAKVRGNDPGIDFLGVENNVSVKDLIKEDLNKYSTTWPSKAKTQIKKSAKQNKMAEKTGDFNYVDEEEEQEKLSPSLTLNSKVGYNPLPNEESSVDPIDKVAESPSSIAEELDSEDDDFDENTTESSNKEDDNDYSTVVVIYNTKKPPKFGRNNHKYRQKKGIDYSTFKPTYQVFNADAPRDMIHNRNYHPHPVENKIYLDAHNGYDDSQSSIESPEYPDTYSEKPYINPARILPEEPTKVVHFNFPQNHHNSNNFRKEMTQEEQKKAQEEANKLMSVDQEFNERNEPNNEDYDNKDDNYYDENNINFQDENYENSEIYQPTNLRKYRKLPRKREYRKNKQDSTKYPSFSSRKLQSFDDMDEVEKRYVRDIDYENGQGNSVSKDNIVKKVKDFFGFGKENDYNEEIVDDYPANNDVNPEFEGNVQNEINTKPPNIFLTPIREQYRPPKFNLFQPLKSRPNNNKFFGRIPKYKKYHFRKEVLPRFPLTNKEILKETKLRNTIGHRKFVRSHKPRKVNRAKRKHKINKGRNVETTTKKPSVVGTEIEDLDDDDYLSDDYAEDNCQTPTTTCVPTTSASTENSTSTSSTLSSTTSSESSSLSSSSSSSTSESTTPPSTESSETSTTETTPLVTTTLLTTTPLATTTPETNEKNKSNETMTGASTVPPNAQSGGGNVHSKNRIDIKDEDTKECEETQTKKLEFAEEENPAQKLEKAMAKTEEPMIADAEENCLDDQKKNKEGAKKGEKGNESVKAVGGTTGKESVKAAGGTKGNESAKAVGGTTKVDDFCQESNQKTANKKVQEGAKKGEKGNESLKAVGGTTILSAEATTAATNGTTIGTTLAPTTVSSLEPTTTATTTSSTTAGETSSTTAGETSSATTGETSSTTAGNTSTEATTSKSSHKPTTTETTTLHDAVLTLSTTQHTKTTCKPATTTKLPKELECDTKRKFLRDKFNRRFINNMDSLNDQFSNIRARRSYDSDLGRRINNFKYQALRKAHKFERPKAKYNPRNNRIFVRGVENQVEETTPCLDNSSKVIDKLPKEFIHHSNAATIEKNEIIRGQLSARIVASLFDEVKQCASLQSSLGAHLQNTHKYPHPIPNLDIFHNNEVRSDISHLEDMLHGIMSSLNVIIEEEVKAKTCIHLDPDSLNFLKALTAASTNPSKNLESSLSEDVCNEGASAAKNSAGQESVPKQDTYLFSTEECHESPASGQAAPSPIVGGPSGDTFAKLKPSASERENLLKINSTSKTESAKASGGSQQVEKSMAISKGVTTDNCEGVLGPSPGKSATAQEAASAKIDRKDGDASKTQKIMSEIPNKKREIKELMKQYNALSSKEKEKYNNVYFYLHKQDILLDRALNELQKKLKYLNKRQTKKRYPEASRYDPFWDNSVQQEEDNQDLKSHVVWALDSKE